MPPAPAETAGKEMGGAMPTPVLSGTIAPTAPGGIGAALRPPPATGMTLREAIQHAQQDPSSEFASTLGGFIQNGDADSQAMKEGIDLSFAGRPALKDMYAQAAKIAKPTPLAKAGNAYMDTIGETADKTAAQYPEAMQHAKESVQKAGEELKEPGGVLPAITDATLGPMSAAVQAIFAPFTGIIQELSQKVQDNKAVQDVASGDNPIGDTAELFNKLAAHIDAASKAHPDAARRVGDAANVLLATLGGETGAGKEANAGDVAGNVGDAAGKIKEQLTPVKGEAPAVEKPPPAEKGASVAEQAKGAVQGQTSTALKSAYSQIYALPPDDIDFLLKNPQYANPQALGDASLYNLGKEVEGKIAGARGNVDTPANLGNEVREALITKQQALREHAMQYPTGSKGSLVKKKIEVDPHWLQQQLENEDVAGMTIDAKSGRIAPSSEMSKVNGLNPSGIRTVQNLWDTWQPAFEKGSLTPQQFIKFRQDLAQLANYNGGFDTDLNKVADNIRDNFNKEYRPSIPGLDKLDATHTKMSRDLERLQKGIAVQDTGGQLQLQDGALSKIMGATKDTKDEFAARLEELVPGITDRIQEANDFKSQWSGIVDENGSLKENSLNTIKNAVNQGRDMRLEKLEKLMPGITDRIRLVKAAEDFNGTLGLKPGKYATGAAVSQVLLGNPFAGLMGIYLSSPRVGLKMLQMIGKMGKGGAAAEAAGEGGTGTVEAPEPSPKAPGGAPRDALIDTLMERGASSLGAELPRETYEEYANYPVKNISVDQINGLDHRGLILDAETPGTRVDVPILVDQNADGSYQLVDGNHRVTQAIVNKDALIHAFVKPLEGVEPAANSQGGAAAEALPGLSRLMQDAANARPQLDALAQRLADAFGGTVKQTPLKKEARVVEKTNQENGGNLSKIKDVARNTIIVPKAQLASVIDALKALPETTYKYQSPEEYHGYSGHLFNIKLSNGHTGEIQVNTPEMVAAKSSGGHKLYKQYRAAAATHGSASAEAAALAEQMRAHYAGEN